MPDVFHPRESVTVFGASIEPNDAVVIAAAEILGETLGREGYDLIVGGTTGLIEPLIRAAVREGARIVNGVLVDKFFEQQAHTLPGLPIVRHRVPDEDAQFAQLMSGTAGAFVLPGGLLVAAEGLRAQLRHNHENGPPVLWVDVADCMDYLTLHFRQVARKGMVRKGGPDPLKLWTPGESARAALKPSGSCTACSG